MKLASFPLLNKELTEQANRKRTYIIRMVLLGIMSIVLVLYLVSEIPSIQRYGYYDSWMMERISKGIMTMVLICQFITVLVLLPATMACVLTSEKERNSLELLLLTRMKAWQIIFQKYFSRIIPTLMFFFLSLPMIAVAYSFGGMDLDDLQWPFYEFFFLVFFIGALGIFWSSFCRTSSMAVVMTYLSFGMAGFLFWLGIPGVIFSRYNYMDEKAYLTCWFFIQGFLSIVFIQFAIFYLKRKVSPKKGNPVLLYFDKIDKFWKDINSLFGDVELIKSEDYRLPENDAILWYEKFKRPVGRIHYLARTVLILSIPTIFLIVACCFIPEAYFMGLVISASLWIIIAFLLMMKTSNIIAEERSNQTLDVLLTTNITPRKLVEVRMKNIFKFRMALSIPLVVTLLMILFFQPSRHGGMKNFPYIVFIYTLIHMSFLVWLCCWLGLRIKKLRQAILVMFMVVTLWFIIPFAPLLLADVCHLPRSDYALNSRDFLEYLSPLTPMLYFSNWGHLLPFYLPFLIPIWYFCSKLKNRLWSSFLFFVIILVWFFGPFMPFLLKVPDVTYSSWRGPPTIFHYIAYLSPVMPIISDGMREFDYYIFILASLVILGLYLWFKHLCLHNAEKYLRTSCSSKLP